ncbi:MAG: ThuA domain-containing protein [Thermogutta sp.]
MNRRSVLLALAVLSMAVTPVLAAQYKALIVTGQNGHDWKGTTPVLKQLLEETGIFTVDVAQSPAKGEDMSGFRPSFKDYQVVVLNYQGDAWPEETKKAFVEYVKNGGGVVVYHFACAAFPDWPEYNEIIGLGGWGGRNEKWGPYVRWRGGRVEFDYSPGRGGGHGPMQPFAIDVRYPEHPIMQGLASRFMHVPDELYGWLRGPAKNLTVLATAFAPKDKGGADEHEPIMFTVQYGKGRVFFHALGHTPTELKSVAFIVPFQRGAEWAASGRVTLPVPDDFPTADKASVRP